MSNEYEGVKVGKPMIRAIEVSAPQTPYNYIDGLLPNELLMRIFKIVCEEMSEFHTGNIAWYRPRSFEPRKSPVDISQVCSRWRTVSLGQSELWRVFGAHVAEGSDRIDADRTMFKQYLDRSKDLPMDLWFSPSMDDLQTGGTALHDALSCPHRVRRLAILFEARNRNADRMVERICKTVWPYLESLEIEISFHTAKFLLPTTASNTGTGFPQLRQLRSNTDLLRHIDQRSLSQLTTLQIERYARVNFAKYPWAILLDLVSTSPLLELFIDEDLFDPPEVAGGAPVVAKNLERFHCGDANVSSRMWTDFSFPNLELLILRGIELGTLQFPYNIDEYRANNRVQPTLAPKLHTLLLSECTPAFGPPSMRFLGYATAPVTHLIIVDKGKVPHEGNVFDRLVANSHISYWPNLEIITFKGDAREGTPHIADPNILQDFLEDLDTVQPFRLRLCLDERTRDEREFHGWDDWERLEDNELFEEFDSDDEEIIEWPRRNFSYQSQSVFDF